MKYHPATWQLQPDSRGSARGSRFRTREESGLAFEIFVLNVVLDLGGSGPVPCNLLCCHAADQDHKFAGRAVKAFVVQLSDPG